MKYQFGLATLFCILFATSANAETLADALKKCSQESNSLKRLVCYDRLNQRAQGYSDSELPPALQAASRAVNTNTNTHAVGNNYASPAENNFGKKAPTEEVESLTASVVKAKKNRLGKLIITLDNGQVWKQTDGGYLGIKAGDSVTIEKGVMGSFMLQKSSGSKVIRVTRTS